MNDIVLVQKEVPMAAALDPIVDGDNLTSPLDTKTITRGNTGPNTPRPRNNKAKGIRDGPKEAGASNMNIKFKQDAVILEESVAIKVL